MDAPPGKEPDTDAASDASTNDTVSLDALAMPDDQEQMQPPAVGDEVNYQVTGKVVSIQGDVATIAKTSVNGQPVDGSGDNDPTDGDDSPDSLRQDASKMDAQGIGLQ